MRFWKLSLNDSLKKGLCSADPALGEVGFASLKGLKTNGVYLYSCALENTVVVPTTITPFYFSMGTRSYYTDGVRIYKRESGAWVDKRAGIGLTNIHFLDFGAYGILTAAGGILFFDTTATEFFTVNPTGFTTPRFKTSTTLNGQIIGGGLLDAWSNLSDEFICWSKIGSDSFVLDKSNDSGYYNPNIGAIGKVLGYGDKVLALGQRGAVLLYYAEHTFGFKPLDLPKPGSLFLGASTKDFAYYIDQHDNLIKVGSKGDFVNLDFAWLMKDVIEVRTLAKSNEVVFTTSENSYIIDHAGMYSYGYRVFGDWNGGLITEGGFEQDTVGFATSSLNADLAGMKTLTEVYIASNSGEVVTAQGFGELNLTTRLTRAVPINNVSGAKIVVQANAIGVIIETVWQRDLRVTSLSVNMAKSDKRFGTGESITRVST